MDERARRGGVSSAALPPFPPPLFFSDPSPSPFFIFFIFFYSSFSSPLPSSPRELALGDGGRVLSRPPPQPRRDCLHYPRTLGEYRP